MLFNSAQFLLGFLPVTLLVFLLLSKAPRKEWALGWLTLASVFFYGWWRMEYVPLLLISVAVNYFLAVWLARSKSMTVYIVGIVANLALLAYFKYTDFTVTVANGVLGTGFSLPGILLPLAISFFTFQQVAFLSDVRAGLAQPPGLLKYALFVTFFPHLIAGPITHHREMTPQFDAPAMFRFDPERFVVGLTIVLIGLLKKTVFADGLALYATPVFDVAAAAQPLSIVEAWLGAIAYTLQLYFDFSGYSDMAIGLGLLFGVRLPLNFNSPYKSRSVIEYWSRWHMTLTRFLTAYVYNPIALAVTRRRVAARKPIIGRGVPRAGAFLALVAFPTFATMFLSGLWHGAGYQFLIFGLLHGTYLTVNQAWRHLKPALGLAVDGRSLVGAAVGWLLTFLCITVAHVFFRAADVRSACTIIETMAGLNGIVFPGGFAYPAFVSQFVAWAGGSYAYLPSFFGVAELGNIAFALAVVLLLPNVGQWMRAYPAALHRKFPTSWIEILLPRVALVAWRPSTACGAFIGVVGFLALLKTFSAAPSEFLYFAF
jgi:alginate O-acetyltransferase complex protein AlgI